MARNIESPGVQLTEIDLSLNASLPVGTNILINGFTDQGPSQELLNITSLTEYEQIYGVPTNAAERYAYHTIKNLLTTPAKVVFNRLPYGGDGGSGYNDQYTALMYPIYTSGGDGTSLSADGDYYIGAPTQTVLSEDEYNSWKQGSISWSLSTSPLTGNISGYDAAGNAGLIIINKIQTSVNQDFEGYYLGLSDNKKANTTALSPDFDFNSLTSIQTSKSHTSGVVVSNKWEKLSDSRLDFELTGNISDVPDSLSEAIETAPTWDFGSPEYNDGLIIGLYKFRRSGYTDTQNALKFIPQETFIGSLGAERKYTDPTGFQETTFFMESIVNDSSNFLDVMVNPNFSEGQWLNDEGLPRKTLTVIDNAMVTKLNSTYIPPVITVTASVSGYDGEYEYRENDELWDTSISGENVKLILFAGEWHVYGTNDGEFTAPSGDGIHPPYSGWVGVSGNATSADNLNLEYKTFSGLEANAAYTLGLYQEKASSVKKIGDIPTKLDLGLRLAEDWDTLPLDIVLDAGLSTIHTTMNLSGGDEFIDITPIDLSDLKDPSDGSSSDATQAWLAIFNKFDIFCRDTRKDCMFIADTYRNIFVNGKDFKTLDDKTKNFSQDVYTPLKNLTSKTNSSYSATYAQWIKVYDNQSSDYAWIPYSGFQGAIMARLDSVLYPWSAPAGLENGNVVGALDLALKTTQKQRDLLYRNNLNAVVFFPSDGIVSWGQKTLQKKPSAFDRINVRRLFLTLEKSTRDLMKYFVFQPNTTFTRTRAVNVLTPIFDVAKNNEGVYDFLIVCDERNNTADVIDNNEMKVDIYLKPVRTAEFILVNFYATRTSQNFSELV